ncbi:hypothetical protein ABI59_15820 [Acidobacteria bacterium Mor1]|nr:hypothetical protein ABI59_15820 [Acidobacteria bacterium Mor1]
MGTWGIGNFENDNAGDWVFELEESRDKSILNRAFAAVGPSGEEREAHVCEEALAAAEVVLAGLSAGFERVPEAVATWVTAKTGLFRRPRTFDSEDARSALAAVKRVLEDSELRDLWAESDELANWEAHQQPLIQGLERHAG